MSHNFYAGTAADGGFDADDEDGSSDFLRLCWRFERVQRWIGRGVVLAPG